MGVAYLLVRDSSSINNDVHTNGVRVFNNMMAIETSNIIHMHVHKLNACTYMCNYYRKMYHMYKCIIHVYNYIFPISVMVSMVV